MQTKATGHVKHQTHLHKKTSTMPRLLVTLALTAHACVKPSLNGTSTKNTSQNTLKTLILWYIHCMDSDAAVTTAAVRCCRQGASLQPAPASYSGPAAPHSTAVQGPALHLPCAHTLPATLLELRYHFPGLTLFLHQAQLLLVLVLVQLLPPLLYCPPD
jgi:hypothetical protein